MLPLEIPGRGTCQIKHLVLDVNGTIAEDGYLRPGVRERLARLSKQFQVVLVTADSYSRQYAIDQELQMESVRLETGKPEAPQKGELIQRLGPDSAVAMGNGANDVLMLKRAAIGIAVLETEGASVEAILSADIVARSVTEALDLLLNPRRLAATLRR